MDAPRTSSQYALVAQRNDIEVVFATVFSVDLQVFIPFGNKRDRHTKMPPTLPDSK